MSELLKEVERSEAKRAFHYLAIPDMSLRAWLVGHILPVLVAGGSSEEAEVAMAIRYADEALKQLKIAK